MVGQPLSLYQIMKNSFLLLALAGLQSSTFFAHAADLSWPQWRGPTRDGMIKDGAPWPQSIAKKKLKLSGARKSPKDTPGPLFPKT